MSYEEQLNFLNATLLRLQNDLDELIEKNKGVLELYDEKRRAQRRAGQCRSYFQVEAVSA